MTTAAKGVTTAHPVLAATKPLIHPLAQSEASGLPKRARVIPAAARTAEAAASKVAKVAISFTQAPEGGETKLGRAVAFNNAVVLRLNPTETGAGAKDETCT